MSDQINYLLDALEATIELLRLRDDQLKEELDRAVVLRKQLHRQWEVNNKLLKERDALCDELASIETIEYFNGEEKDSG